MLKWLAMFVLILFVLSLPSPYAQVRKVGGNPPNGHAQREAPHPQADQRGSKDSPLVVDMEQHPQNEAEAADSKRKEDIESSRKNWEIVLTAVIALAAIGQAVGVALQVCINRRQQRAYENAERAWLSSEIYQPNQEQMNIKALPFNGGVPVTVTIANTGKTAARFVDSAMRIQIVNVIDPTAPPPVKPQLPVEPQYRTEEDPPSLIAPVGTTWNPGQKFVYQSFISKTFFEKNDLPAWQIANKMLCVYGFVEYDDAFGKRHITRFCYAYEKIRAPFALTDMETGRPLFPAAFGISGPPAYNRAT